MDMARSQMLGLYVSITGFTPKSIVYLPRFWWHTLRCLSQARRSPGNLGASARYSRGVYHTLTLWTDKEAMAAYIADGAHLNAMRHFKKIGSGRVYGFYNGRAPEWGAAYALWSKFGSDV
jgi:hypothetical protein